MSETESRITITEHGKIARVQFRDRNILDEGNIQQIGEEIAQIIDGSPTPKILIDFQNVEHLSSAALGALITVNNKVKRKGGQLRLANIDPQIYEVFAITKLNTLFKIYDNAEEACTSFT